ncbi:tetratricopeptide repeat protein [Candidatus Marinimicrobia bacterium PRS2]|nr:tetratricopeptide repeat protein [Candidatus Marinimicrobia bacterium PRS2]
MPPPIERKLAAIMFTDIVGYTAQMSKDEAVAISLLNKQESILKPLILEHNGTYVKSTGDGTLSHFNSAVDAATCAKRFQESIYDDKDLNVRVGVHLGDTIFEKGDIRGDGVNIASRLESMAVAGGVFVSKEVHDQLANQKEFEGVSLGLQSMKGVGRLIEVYGLKGDKLNEPNPTEYQDNKIDKHTDDEVPSIAIIPFDNKGKEEDAFYAYGISVDLISDVTSAGLIRVASKKQIEDAGELPIDELAKKLDVRYIANGELWRMGDMFQLSIELYDTRDKKVIWSDRWQESWDNLTAIKGNLSDGLLKALDTKPKAEKATETTNPEAYEYYLRAKHKYEKRENKDDTEIARGLLKKALELDNNLIGAKVLLGWTYSEKGDYDKAMEIYTPAFNQAEELGDKPGMGSSLNSIGAVYNNKGEYDIALGYYERSLAIAEELGDKHGMVASLNNIGLAYHDKGDYETALDYLERSLTIAEELGEKRGMGNSLNNIGLVYSNKGDYKKAEEYLEKSLALQKEIGLKGFELETTTYLYLTYKHLGKEYDVNEIHSHVKEAENIEFELNYAIYQLLEDKSHLETAYNQIQEKTDNLEPDVKAKFLELPIPKAIVEEWEKVK